MRHVVCVAVLGALAAGACSRNPPEPTKPAPAGTAEPPGVPPLPPAPTVSAASAATTGRGPERCVRLSPAQPPRPAPPVNVARCPKDPGGAPTLATASLVFPEASSDGGEVRLDAEIAKQPADTERGLMYRMKMPEDHGMIFVLGERKEHVFWMHNTCLSLDMLFVDEDGYIVGILENVPTLDDDERTVGCASTWVIETNAGWTRRHGVRAGQHVKIPANL